MRRDCWFQQLFKKKRWRNWGSFFLSQLRLVNWMILLLLLVTVFLLMILLLWFILSIQGKMRRLFRGFWELRCSKQQLLTILLLLHILRWITKDVVYILLLLFRSMKSCQLYCRFKSELQLLTKGQNNWDQLWSSMTLSVLLVRNRQPAKLITSIGYLNSMFNYNDSFFKACIKSNIRDPYW